MMRSSPIRPSRGRGFTLVEVLVALTIMAVMAGVTWQGIDGMVRSRDGSQAAVEATLRANTALAQWEQDLAALEETRVVPALRFDGATLRLTRRVSQGPLNGLQVVAWTLRDGAWWRWAGPEVTRVAQLQQAWTRSQMLMGEEPGMLKVLEGAQAAQVYFFRGESWTNAQSTGDVQNVATVPGAMALEKLPSGVRLVLTLGGHPLTRDLVLAPQVP
jgi:general secretion pathway protein J